MEVTFQLYLFPTSLLSTVTGMFELAEKSGAGEQESRTNTCVGSTLAAGIAKLEMTPSEVGRA